MWLERISGGGVPLVSTADAKTYLRILSDETDAEVDAAVAAASSFLDVDDDGFGGLGFPVVSQQWSVKAEAFSAQLLRLPFSRIASVDEIRFVSSAGQSEAVAAQDYQLVKCGREWRIALVSGATWPVLASRPDAVDIRFTAGWPDVESVPGDFIDASKILTAHFFHFRGANADKGISEDVMRAVDRLTARYRRFSM